MPKRNKKGKTKKQSNSKLLNLNKLPIPDEIVKLMISFLPKKWTVPRIPKKMNSQLYSLRLLNVNNENQLFDINTPVKIKKSIHKIFQNEFKYLVPPSKESIGKIVGYVSPESYIGNEVNYWKIKHAKPYKGDILYKVLFLQKHNSFQGRDNFQGVFWPRELDNIKSTKELPCKWSGYYEICNIAIQRGIYYLYPDEVKFYMDIEDRQVCITKKNKIMFDKSQC